MILLRCYPKVTDFIYELFNHATWADFRFLPVYSYGFFVACGFFAAATLAVNEMQRREKLGLLKGQIKQTIVGESPGMVETAIYFLFGFFTVFKLVGFKSYQHLFNNGTLSTSDYLFSLQYGNWAAGILGGAALAGWFYYNKHKDKLPVPEKKEITVYPSEGIGDLVIIAAVLGITGANFFNFLENPGDYTNFWSDPLGSMFSGLSVYGGLICAGAGFGVYAYIKKFSIAHFFDSVAPGFILANGIGRIGCQVAGDGDWGLANPYTKPAWFPQILWSDNYAHNIIDADPGNLVPNCTEEHCNQLIYAAYPTPLYEFLMCFVIFLILWSLRKRFTYAPGIIFSIFMMMIGVQRFAIEQWRDLSGRDTYGFLGMQFRQSELISVAMFTLGLVATVFLYRKYREHIPAK